MKDSLFRLGKETDCFHQPCGFSGSASGGPGFCGISGSMVELISGLSGLPGRVGPGEGAGRGDGGVGLGGAGFGARRQIRSHETLTSDGI